MCRKIPITIGIILSKYFSIFPIPPLLMALLNIKPRGDMKAKKKRDKTMVDFRSGD